MFVCAHMDHISNGKCILNQDRELKQGTEYISEIAMEH